MKNIDARKIFLLGKQYFGSKSDYSWDWSISSIQQYLKKSFGLGIVCVEKRSIIGFVLVQKNYSSQNPNVSLLTYIFVDKECRKQGIASKLLDFTILKLSKSGKTVLITDIYSKNKLSLKFFKKLNFQIKEKWLSLSRQL